MPVTAVAETEAAKAAVATRTKNWDRIVQETGEEKEEGEAALNTLFQRIYADGTDEVRRAMNKSFVSVLLSTTAPLRFQDYSPQTLHVQISSDADHLRVQNMKDFFYFMSFVMTRHDRFCD